MYTRQKFFNYRDKPNKLLAWVLAQEHPKASIPDIMIAQSGEEINSTEGKLELLVDDYQELYRSSCPCKSNIENFLKKN